MLLTRSISLISLATTISIVTQMPVYSASIHGGFSWVATGDNMEIFRGTADFQLDKEPFSMGTLNFTVTDVPNPNPFGGLTVDEMNAMPDVVDFSIRNPTFGTEWDLLSFEFMNNSGRRGTINFAGNSVFNQPDGENVTLSLSNTEQTPKHDLTITKVLTPNILRLAPGETDDFQATFSIDTSRLNNGTNVNYTVRGDSFERMNVNSRGEDNINLTPFTGSSSGNITANTSIVDFSINDYLTAAVSDNAEIGDFITFTTAINVDLEYTDPETGKQITQTTRVDPSNTVRVPIDL